MDRRRWWPYLTIALLALAATATSLENGFAYDDIHLIVQNPRVHTLVRAWEVFGETYWPPVGLGPAGRLYRPLSVLGFTIEWALGHGAPLVFHLFNVVLYIAGAVAIYSLARRLLDPLPAWWAAAIFAVHPAHTEAVANGVGQSELSAGLLMILAAWVYLGGRGKGRLTPSSIAVIAVLYAIACLLKEHGIMLPALLVVLELAGLSDGRPWRAQAEDLGKLALVLLLIAVLYLRWRTSVLHGLAGDEPHVALAHLTAGQRLLTMLGVVPIWLRLALWPVHLQADYSPPDIQIATGFGGVQVAGLLIVGAVVVLAFAARRRAPVVTAGLGWMAVALLPVSNLLTPTGVILAERTLFLPSVGLALALGGGVQWLTRREWNEPRLLGRAALAGGLLLLFLGGYRSAVRQPVWRDSATLFRQTVLDAPRDYWARSNFAGSLVLADKPDSAIAEYQHALSLFDGDAAVFDLLGSVYRQNDRCSLAIPLLRRSLSLDASRRMTRIRLISCLAHDGDFAAARVEAEAQVAAGREEFRAILDFVTQEEAAAAKARGKTP